MKPPTSLQNVLSAINHNPLRVVLDTTVLDAIALMSETRSSYVLVMERQETNPHAIGIFTERDVIRLSAQSTPIENTQTQILAEMSHPVITIQVSELTNINAALGIFQHHQIRHLPVLQGDRLIGMLTKDSLTEILAQNSLQSTEATLQENEQFLRSIYEGVEQAIFVIDVLENGEFRIIGFNPFAEKVSGKSTAEICGNQPHEKVRQHYADCLQAGTSITYEECLYFELNPTWWMTTLNPIRDASSRIVRIVGTSINITERKQAEELLAQQTQALESLNQELENRVEERSAALKASEEIFRNAFTNTAVGMCLVSIEGKFLKVNECFCNFVGYSEAELLELTFHEITHPDHLNVSIELAKQILTDETKAHHIEKCYITKQGELVWGLVSSALVRDDYKRPLYFVTQIQDISDRKQAKLALDLEILRRNTVFNASSDGIHILDTAGNLIESNDQFAQMLGYPPTEVAGLNVADWDAQISAEELEEMLKDESLNDFVFETLHRRKDGSIFPVEISRREMEWQGERFLVCISRDISDRKRLEQEQTRLISILEASTDYIGISDLQGNVIWNNSALKHLRGEDIHQETTKRPVFSDHPQWVIDLYQREVEPTMQTQNTWVGETALLDADGQEVPVSQLIIAHRSAQGEIEFFSTIMRDMRARKEYEQRLELSNIELLRATRLKDEFLATMSHELRTPLNAILGMTEILQEEVLGKVNAKQLKSLSTIETSANHLLSLINDILDVSKIEAGQFQLDCTTTNLSLLCQSSLAFVKQQALNKRIQLKTKIPKDLPDILIDDRRIRQSLINLLSNAVKFTSQGGCITLEVTLREVQNTNINSWIHIAVIDTGIGIAPENIQKLFQPFIQIDSALNRQYTGTGLGLALVKRIVELHGGNVSLTSELGVGSCFTIELPYSCILADTIAGDPKLLASIVPSSSINNSISETSSQPPSILLAEDNEANVSTISGYLEAIGYGILIASNGLEAIAMTKRHNPDLILMDIQMPEMDGLEAIKQIRTDLNFVNIPIIALTALAMEGDRQKCLDAGANEYLAKPIKLKVLSQIIQDLLAPKN